MVDIPAGDFAPPISVKNRFSALCNAARAGQLCVMQCTDAKTGAAAHVVCAVQPEGGELLGFYPLAVIPEEEDMSVLYDYVRDKDQLNG